MADKAHVATDREIARMERHIAGIYREAQKDVSAELQKYADLIRVKSDKLLQAINDAKDEKARKAAESAYKRFYLSEVKRDKRFIKASQNVSERLYRANRQAAEYINSKSANIYAINYNQIGRGLQKDLDGYDFKPVTEDEADKYGQITRQTVDKKKDTAWNEKNVRNAVIAGAVALYAINKIFKNAANSTTKKNRSSSNRQASDTMTDAENKGRLDSMYRASDEGFSVKKDWWATLDNRTRDTHIEYDSMEPVELDYEYARGLKRPRDTNCAIMAEICNCRCRLTYTTGKQRNTTRAAREGEVTGSYKKASSFKDTKTINVKDMPFKEWMAWRSK